MGLQIGGVNHDGLFLAVFGGQAHHDLGKDTFLTPPLPAIVGAYSDVKGHHVFSQANMRGVTGYSSSSAFSFGNELLDGIATRVGKTRSEVHQLETNVQRQANARWAAEGITPTVRDHFYVARDGLQAMGLTRSEADVIAWTGLRQLNQAGIDDAVKTRVWGQ